MAGDGQPNGQADQYPNDMDSYNALIATSLQGKPSDGHRLAWIELINNEDPGIVHYDPPQGNEAVGQDLAYLEPDPGANASPGPYYGSSDNGQSNGSPKLAISPEDEEAQSSGDDHQYEEYSYDPECEIDEESSTHPPEVTKPQHLPTISKIQKRRDVLARKGIVLDSNGTRKGVVRKTASGGVEVLHHGEWIAAVYHHEIRGKLLQMTDRNGKYDVEPARGAHKLDRTAFKKDQQHWEFGERNSRPELLFVWDDPGDRADDDPELWYDGGRMVLSVANRPLRKFSEIPLTLSGQCEGLRLEAFRRLNSNISLYELRARMPITTCKRPGLRDKAVELPALGNRIARSRLKTVMKAWCMKEGSDVKIHRMLEMIPQDIQEEIVRTNSTRCFRDFTQAEMAYIGEGNKGTESSMKKAGLRRLPEDIRREKEEQKRLTIKGKKGNGLEIHPVVAEALERKTPVPKTPHGSRYNVSAKTSSTSRRFPRTKGGPSQNRTHREPGTSGVEFSPLGNAKRPASSELGTLFCKRPRVVEDESVNQAEGDKHSGYGQSATEEDSDENATGKPRPGPDFRYKKPTTAQEKVGIQEALSISLDDYERYMGYPPPFRTDRTESYAFQLSELQASLSEHTGLGDYAPILKQWGKWSSMESWRAMATPNRGVNGGAKKKVSGLEGDTLVDRSPVD
ncbi:MAG: hypothetical protein Q9196_006289 [Gyalolechia fulgens]